MYDGGKRGGEGTDVRGDIASLLIALVAAGVIGQAGDGRAVGLADDFDLVGGSACSVVISMLECYVDIRILLLTFEWLLQADGELAARRWCDLTRHVGCVLGVD